VLSTDSQVTWPQLTVQTSQLQKEGWSSPPGSQWLTYQRKVNCFQTRGKSRLLDFEPVAIRYAYLKPVRPRRANTLFASETLRTDFLCLLEKSVDKETWEAFAGKHSDSGAQLGGHGHPYILPQPATDQSQLLGEVLVYRAPSQNGTAFPRETLDVFTRQLGWLQEKRQRSFRVQFVEFLDERRLKQLKAFQASKQWQSQTPYVQTRHLKAGRETILDQVRRELVNHNGPAELLESVEILERVIDGLQVRDFKTQRQNRPRPTSGVHNLRLLFSEPVCGPVVLGYGAHFGLGQFKPVR